MQLHFWKEIHIKNSGKHHLILVLAALWDNRWFLFSTLCLFICKYFTELSYLCRKRKRFYFSPFSALIPTTVSSEKPLPCLVTNPLNTFGDDFLTLDIKNLSISFTLQSFSLSPGPVRFVTQGAWREHGVRWLPWDTLLCPSSSCHSVVLQVKERGTREKSERCSWAPLKSAISLCCFLWQVPDALCVMGSKHRLSQRAVRCLPSNPLISFKHHLLFNLVQPPASHCQHSLLGVEVPAILHKLGCLGSRSCDPTWGSGINAKQRMSMRTAPPWPVLLSPLLLFSPAQKGPGDQQVPFLIRWLDRTCQSPPPPGTPNASAGGFLGISPLVWIFFLEYDRKVFLKNALILVNMFLKCENVDSWDELLY